MNLEIFFSHPRISRICHKTGIWRDSSSLPQLYEKLLPFLDTKWVLSLHEDCSRFLNSKDAEGIQLISIFHPGYPFLLKETFDPPLVLALKGSLSVFAKNTVSVVGTRKASPISILATRFLISSLKEQNENLCIVSGMALGIDRESFRVSIDLGVPVLGVLGTCLYEEYPPQNRDLYAQVKEDSHSALISEFVFPTQPARWTFPKRNRLISGLSAHLYIMESGKKSGTLSTAMSALSENREIHVFDHPLQYDNEGGKKLLEEGAHSISWEFLSQNKGYISYPSQNDDEKEVRKFTAEEWRKREVERRSWLYQTKAAPLGKGAYWIFNP